MISSVPAPKQSGAASPPAAGRLLSLDALRGFDMFWIIGADDLVGALRKISSDGVTGFLATQLDHVKWEGFHFEDLIFPLFVFMMGTAIPFSLGRIVELEGRRKAHMRLLRRTALLYLLGIFYYGGFAHEWPGIRLVGVLQRIALCYLFAGLLFLNTGRRGMVASAIALLAGYWALLSFVPAPGMDHVSFAPEQNWPNYIDLHYLHGKLWDKTWDPEGLLSTLPAIVSALFGVFAGLLLKNRSIGGKQKVIWLIGSGAASVVLGMLWGLQFPIIKKLWTSSYVLVAGGYSAILLGLFYAVIDVRGISKWAKPFLWIGTNALTIYMAVNLVEFDHIAARFVGGDVRAACGVYGDLLVTAVALLLPILLVRFLYQRRIFLRL